MKCISCGTTKDVFVFEGYSRCLPCNDKSDKYGCVFVLFVMVGMFVLAYLLS